MLLLYKFTFLDGLSIPNALIIQFLILMRKEKAAFLKTAF